MCVEVSSDQKWSSGKGKGEEVIKVGSVVDDVMVIINNKKGGFQI